MHGVVIVLSPEGRGPVGDHEVGAPSREVPLDNDSHRALVSLVPEPEGVYNNAVGTQPTEVSAQTWNARASRSRAGGAAEVALVVGSPGWARTSDFLINSQALYQLSYRGTS